MREVGAGAQRRRHRPVARDDLPRPVLDHEGAPGVEEQLAVAEVAGEIGIAAAVGVAPLDERSPEGRLHREAPAARHEVGEPREHREPVPAARQRPVAAVRLVLEAEEQEGRRDPPLAVVPPGRIGAAPGEEEPRVVVGVDERRRSVEVPQVPERRPGRNQVRLDAHLKAHESGGLPAAAGPTADDVVVLEFAEQPAFT